MPTLPRRMIPILVLSLQLSACDDKGAASEKTFERALQAYYDGHPECMVLPIDVTDGMSFGPGDPLQKQVEAMTAAGLLSATPGAAGKTQYSVTPVGEHALQKGPDPFLGGLSLCYAHRRIVRVVSFTPPIDVLGMRASTATYDYELRDIEPWAKAGSFQAAFPAIEAALGQQTHRETAGLVLVDHRWLDERTVR